jgi:hypothetical protein
LESIQLRRNYSRNVLLRMFVLGLIAAGVIFWQRTFLADLYLRDQHTNVGLLINGFILTLFTLGILRLIVNFLVYMREESAVSRFLVNLEKSAQEPLRGISRRSIVARRYLTMQELHDSHTPIYQSVLASTLVASESSRASFPKYVNNILILLGAFGTIVSLSVALVGASKMLDTMTSPAGLGLVLHGMSTAANATITAIMCYVFFSYFYLKHLDVQTQLIGSVEKITTTYLLPRFQVQTDSVLYEFTGLIRSLQTLVTQMEQSQRVLAEVDKHFINTAEAYRSRIQSFSEDLESIKHLLRVGFRLHEKE